MLKKLKPLKFGAILIISVFLTLGFSISLQSLLAAWTAPSANPPNNNISDLNLGGGLSVALNALVNGNFTTMGKVGVGTTSPDSQLHLYKNDNINNAEIAIQSGNGATLQDKWSIYQDRVGGELRFWNNNVPDDRNALTILNNGNVGIGLTVPTEKLDVNGIIKSVQVNSGQYCDVSGENCKSAEDMGSGGTLSLVEILNAGNDASGKKITNISDPTDNQDVASKKYVDSVVANVQPAGIKVPTGLYGNCFDWVKTTRTCWGTYCFGTDSMGCTIYGDPAICDAGGVTGCKCPTGFSRVKVGDGKDSALIVGSFYSCLAGGTLYPPLYNDKHTEKDCTNLGGAVVDYGGKKLCEFTYSGAGVSFATRCSSKGFNYYDDVVQTVPHSCTEVTVNSKPCTYYCTANGSSAWHQFTTTTCNSFNGTTPWCFENGQYSYGIDQCMWACTNGSSVAIYKICDAYVGKARCY